MKKILKSITLILVLSFGNVAFANDTEIATNIGHALSNVTIALNNLDKADYCFLKTTIENTSLSEEQKSTTLRADPEINNYLNVVKTNVDILNNNNAQTFIQDPERQKLVVDVLTKDFDSRPDIGGCEPYHAGRRACNTKFVSCSTLGYIGCLASTFLYEICATAVFLTCTADFVSCHDLNSAQYPDCSGQSGGGVIIKWNPWLSNNSRCLE